MRFAIIVIGNVRENNLKKKKRTRNITVSAQQCSAPLGPTPEWPSSWQGDRMDISSKLEWTGTG
jgi:hypothetical protein